MGLAILLAHTEVYPGAIPMTATVYWSALDAILHPPTHAKSLLFRC